MKEDNQLFDEFVYIGFWKRVLMTLVELLVMSIPFVLLYRLSIFISINSGYSIPFILHWVVSYSFLIFMVVRYGGTPGKLIFKARIVDRQGKNLTVSKAFLRFSFYLINSIILVLIFQEGLNSTSTVQESMSNLSENKGTYSNIQTLMGFIILFDSVFILFNRKRKRTIHDYLAGSYVITKESQDRYINKGSFES
jgi:uncharacterized RDD family membrane protein YckC